MKKHSGVKIVHIVCGIELFPATDMKTKIFHQMILL